MSSAARLARALAGPFLVIGTRYNDVAKKYPQATAVITTTIKTSAADAFAQLVRPMHALHAPRHVGAALRDRFATDARPGVRTGH